MDLIGHEHLRMQRAVGLHQCLAQPTEIAPIVVLGEEARLAIVTTLHDMNRNAIKVAAGGRAA